MSRHKWPIDPAQVPSKGATSGHYHDIRRWLARFQGPKVRTESQLLEALTRPEVFYILPQRFR